MGVPSEIVFAAAGDERVAPLDADVSHEPPSTLFREMFEPRSALAGGALF
jgi:hypothetical protein